jgi:hypothetical protein
MKGKYILKLSLYPTQPQSTLGTATRSKCVQIENMIY